ncbi:glycoside hydrolase family 28 protein [Acidomyces richmondensis BFW]|nr:MAG: glycoside hydrolase family 28 protein [Acidomyces sp. 'richmondensis']KYG47242.1 glycoside hydrolase family 28 protein [Acidomyces richmondensis BFW]
MLLPAAFAQLSDPSAVGPTTSTSAKASVKVCNVNDYGAVADGTTDLGPPLLDAFNACSTGGVVEVPAGTYAMATFVTLSGGDNWAFNLEGIIERTGNISSGNMIAIENSNNFEFYSSNGQGAIQGFGYQFLELGEYGPRLLRLQDVSSFSVHDIALVDSPAYHLVLASCENGVAYNMIIRGANLGGLDGVDVWGTNIWVHDIEVTNKDECVTVKSPSSNILVEDIYCNWSGGCAAGSLNDDTNVTQVQYKNVYSQNCNQMFMFKSNGGNGTCSDFVLENFIGHKNAYSLYINAYWASESVQPGNGVIYDSITFSNWTGDCADGTERAPIFVDCPSTQPCTNINLQDISIWTDSGTEEFYKCENAWGEGYCVRSGSNPTAYSSTITVTATPTGWEAPYMPSDLSTGFATNASIPIPTVPTTFFPGQTPATARAYS